MKLGLFGHPVGHSRSPRLFARLARELGRPIAYEAVDAAPGELGAAIERARRRGWRGANVTVPLKAEAGACADRLTPSARAVGAVNVLRFDDALVGHNTDAQGLADALSRAEIPVRDARALVFGAGGAARAAGWALARGGAKSVRFSARTTLRARQAAKDLSARFPKTRFSAGESAAAEIWVNATPLGMNGFPDRCPAPSSLPAPRAAVDLVYGRRTAFQRRAASLGARVEDGSAMLVFQALRAWEFWDRPLGARRRAALAEVLLKEIVS